MTTNAPVVAMDIGGTHIRAALVAADGTILDQHRQRAELSHLTGNVAAAVMDALTAAAAPLLPLAKAVGIGFPGFISDGVVAGAPNIPQMEGVALQALLCQRMQRPVRLDNDAACAALGEWRFGAGRGAASLLHLTLGTGIGGGLVHDGRIFGGDCGMAFEFGHLRINSATDARRCGCGNRGCVETYASATAVGTRYSEAAGGEARDAAEVNRLAQQGDVLAQQVWHQAGSALGVAIAQAIKLLDVRTVTISGGMIAAWHQFQPAMMAAIDTHVIAPQRGRIQVLPSTLEDCAGLLGAAALVMKLP
ncbi:MAG: ROK family protein [Mariprofundales bacterium]|nr:ROK family protein [Mariprofundales bacterium]